MTIWAAFSNFFLLLFAIFHLGTQLVEFRSDVIFQVTTSDFNIDGKNCSNSTCFEMDLLI